MGTAGEPWKPPVDIVMVLKKYRGVLYKALPELKCCRMTALRYINKDPELAQLLKDLRNGYVEDNLDIAEAVITTQMESEKVEERFKAAVYYLNNQGRSRGYAHPDSMTQPGDKIVVVPSDLSAGSNIPTSPLSEESNKGPESGH